MLGYLPPNEFEKRLLKHDSIGESRQTLPTFSVQSERRNNVNGTWRAVKMAEKKYEKYIVTDLRAPDWRLKQRGNRPKIGDLTLWLDDDVVKGAFHVECAWLWPGTDLINYGAHKHDFDEIKAFFGSNPDDTHDLCGEIEWWFEDEQYILTKSTILFIPKGIKHAPFIVRRVDRPIFNFTVMCSSRYSSEMST